MAWTRNTILSLFFLSLFFGLSSAAPPELPNEVRRRGVGSSSNARPAQPDFTDPLHGIGCIGPYLHDSATPYVDCLAAIAELKSKYADNPDFGYPTGPLTRNQIENGRCHILIVWAGYPAEKGPSPLPSPSVVTSALTKIVEECVFDSHRVGGYSGFVDGLTKGLKLTVQVTMDLKSPLFQDWFVAQVNNRPAGLTDEEWRSIGQQRMDAFHSYDAGGGTTNEKGEEWFP